MEYSAMTPSTGLIVDIFLEIIPLGGDSRFYSSQLVDLIPPPASENKHVSYVEAGREWKEIVGMEGPKKKITLTFGRSAALSPSLLAFPTQMLSLCIRPNSISFR